MSAWNDFNDASSNANLIPKGTIAKVHLTLRPGGYDDASQGWTGGYAKRGMTGSVYLDAEYTVLEGPYAKRKIWSMIGLYSPNGPNWGNMGRSFVRNILNSARGIADNDNSPDAQKARTIAGFSDLEGIEFVARIDVSTDGNGEPKNEIRAAVTKSHKDYAAFAGQPRVALPAPAQAVPQAQPSYTPQQPAYAPQAAPAPQAANLRPTWAK
jgi:hypothetical protein